MQKGEVMSAEQRQKIGDAQRGRTLSETHRARLSVSHVGKPNGWSGKHHKPESIEAIRAKRVGVPLELETVEKIRVGMRGKQNSLGYRLSPVHREAVRAAQVGNRHVKEAPVLGECAYCGGSATTEDHILPECRGGSDSPENRIPACNSCNDSKKCRTPDEWLDGITVPHGADYPFVVAV